VWAWAQVLLVGALLTPGQRTVTSALRAMGLSHEAQYQNYHRVISLTLLIPQPASALNIQMVCNSSAVRTVGSVVAVA